MNCSVMLWFHMASQRCPMQPSSQPYLPTWLWSAGAISPCSCSAFFPASHHPPCQSSSLEEECRRSSSGSISEELGEDWQCDLDSMVHLKNDWGFMNMPANLDSTPPIHNSSGPYGLWSHTYGQVDYGKNGWGLGNFDNCPVWLCVLGPRPRRRGFGLIFIIFSSPK